MSGGSQGRRLARALLEQETTVRAENVVRIRFHCPRSGKLIGNGCLDWLQSQMFQNENGEMKRIDVKSTWSII